MVWFLWLRNVIHFIAKALGIIMINLYFICIHGNITDNVCTSTILCRLFLSHVVSLKSILTKCQVKYVDNICLFALDENPNGSTAEPTCVIGNEW